MRLRGRKSPRSVESLLALLGGAACFLVILVILYLLLTRPLTGTLVAMFETAIAPLGFAVVQCTKR
jgi:hypothetical protein